MAAQGSLSRPQAIRRLKIYGERNVGTHYIEALIAQNLTVHVLPGRVPRSHLPTHLVGRIKQVLPQVGRLHEAIRDRYFDAHFARDLGWKHMCPDPARIGAQALEDVCFVCVAKNPYSWLLSLFRNPYHVGGRDVDFATFLKRRLPVMEKRENIGSAPLSPVEVWNRKIWGYLALQSEAAQVRVLTYESFLRDEIAVIDDLASSFGLHRQADHQPVASGVKGSDRSIARAAYVDYYLEERWHADLNPENVKYINDLLDSELVGILGYEMLDPASVG